MKVMAEGFSRNYGNISKSSVGAIQRAVQRQRLGPHQKYRHFHCHPHHHQQLVKGILGTLTEKNDDASRRYAAYKSPHFTAWFAAEKKNSKSS